MTDLEKVQNFINRDDLDEAESKVRDKCVSLQDALQKASAAVQESQKDLQEKHTAEVRTDATFQGMLALALELENIRLENETQAGPGNKEEDKDGTL